MCIMEAQSGVRPPNNKDTLERNSDRTHGSIICINVHSSSKLTSGINLQENFASRYLYKLHHKFESTHPESQSPAMFLRAVR